MTPRLWCLREQVRLVITGAPAPPSTWSSVVRRVIVVAAFFAAGIFTHDLATWALCCFGAVQLGTVDVALPFRRLVAMLSLMIVCITTTVFVAMCLGGTWWSVLFIAGVAFMYGYLERGGGAVAVASLGALALGVILAGEPRLPGPAAAAASLVALGMLVQALAWLVVLRHERRALVRRALALKLRSVAALLRDVDSSPAAQAACHAETQRMDQTIEQAGLRPIELGLALGCASNALTASRAATAWLHLRAPGAADRLAVSTRLRHAARRLNGPVWRREPRQDSLPMVDDSWAISRALLSELDRVDAGVEGVITGTVAPEPPDPLGLSRQLVDQARQAGVQGISTLTRLRTGSVQHGVRMAIGVGVAEALSIAVPAAHSFWLPLTVVFTLKPDWSFTVVRGFTRTLGNLAAVLLVPTLMLAFGGSGWGLLAALVALTTVTFRWFLGNYIWASFGLAGTVLVLDFAMEPSADLFAARIVATIVGALLSVAVASVMSGRVSGQAGEKVGALAQAFASWTTDARAAVSGQAVPAERLEAGLMAARRALVDFEPVASAVVFELRPAVDPVALTMAYSSAARLDDALVAVTASAMLGVHVPAGGPSSAERQSLEFEMLRLTEFTADFERTVARIQSRADALLTP